jgi:hypothetical protein
MKTAIGGCAERLCRLVVKPITFATLSLLTAGVASAGSWTPLVHRPAVNSIQLMVLMTDGSIMVHTFDDIQTWVRLTPDAKGSYVNGSWKTLGKMITPRLYFASQVLPNGKLWVMGGEYTGPFEDPNWGPQAEIYDPLANKWSEAAGDPPQEGCGLVPVTSSVNLHAGSTLIKGIYSTYRILAGWTISGTGIKADTTVVEVDSPTSVTMSAKATYTGPAVIQFMGEPNSCFGDDPSILVPKHNILVGDLLGRQTYLYSIAENAFTPAAPKVYNDSSDEEGWAVLPGGKILNYDLFQSIAKQTGYAETYNPATDLWTSISPADGTARGELPVLSDTQVGFELGPIIRVLDGRTLVIGANQHTALYTPSSNTWAPGPDMRADLAGPGGTIPKAKFGADDAPAASLPNGHVFLIADPGPNPVPEDARTKAGSTFVKVRSTAGMQSTWSVAQADGKNTTIPANAVIFSVDSPTSITLGTFDSSGNLVALKALKSRDDIGLVFGGIFSSPAQLFDFDPKVGSMDPIPGPAGSLLSTEAAFVTRMLVLPTGQLLLSDSSNQLYVYTPDGSPPASLRPKISDVNYTGNGAFRLTGVRLNGQSAGAAYGDDDQMDEDYPIVRLQNPATGNVYYCRTTNWDSVSVDGQKPEKVDFTLNSAVTPGSYELTVVGAGIASQPVPIRIAKGELEQIGEAFAEVPAEDPAVSSPMVPPSIKLMRVPTPIHREK